MSERSNGAKQAMATAITQARRTLSLQTPLGEDVLLMNSFSGAEEISRLFNFSLDLLAERGQKINFDDIVGKAVTITLLLPDDEKRYFNGVLGRISQGHRDTRFDHYRAEVYPWFWLLNHKSNCRIFQDKSIPEIVNKIFDEAQNWYPQLSVRDATTADKHIKLDYCVQYRESDFNFVSRLLEQDGIFYFFEHDQNTHTLVLADANSLVKNCPVKSTFLYWPEGGYAEREEVITSWEMEQEVRPGKYTIRDHHFELPSKSLESSESGKNDALEIYDYPGGHASRFNKPGERLGSVESEGGNLARIRMEEEELPGTIYRGTSDSRYLIAGYKFKLSKHFSSDGDYILTSVNYAVDQSPSYVSDKAIAEPYRCTFSCVSASTPIRPPRVTPKPFVQGPQTAVVTVKDGEESWLDKYGRVRVQFHWDREGQDDENSTCWVRVAQPWAGNKWGVHFWPRIAQEVVVDFLEGDPDQPIITGSFYNASQMPPYPLPDHYTMSGVKTYSSKGGDGFNELRFEDKKGDEQIFMHAEKNLDIRVKNDEYETVSKDLHLIVEQDRFEHIKNDHHETVDRDQAQSIGRDHHLKVTGKQAVEVSGSHSFKVDGDVAEQFGSNHAEQVSQALYLKAGMTIVLEAPMGITLKCGGNSVVLDPTGVTLSSSALITIQGTLVNINSGPGSPPATGTPGSIVPPMAPKDAHEADDADPGEMAELKKQQMESQTGKYGTAPMTPFKPPSQQTDEEKKPHWIEIKLVDRENKPVPGEQYRVTLPDGQTVAEGTLDEKGFARVDGIDPGTCKVTFPNLDESVWKPK